MAGHKKKAGQGGPQLDRYVQRVTREIHQLRHPETKQEITEQQAHGMFEKSDRCTRAMFLPYKDQAKKQWVNKLSKVDWQEGVEPDLTNAPTTQTTEEVGKEFAKLFQMVFAKKHIDAAGSRTLFNKLKRKAIKHYAKLSAAKQRQQEWVTF